MSIKIGINGYGRIGRCILRAIYENKLFRDDFKVVAINDLGTPEINLHLTKYDTTHGFFNQNVRLDNNHMVIDDDYIKILSHRDPNTLPWKELDVDIVFECTGLFTSKKKSEAHLNAGAKKVIISAPSGNNVDATIVYGVNHYTLSSKMTVISNASCTTNCLSPIAQVMNNSIGIVEGLMTTIHSYTNDQRVVDSYHSDMYRSRAASYNMIPTKTGAAIAVGLVLPELQGRLDGLAIRVPTINVSVIDLTFTSKRLTSVKEVNEIMKFASDNTLNGILSYNEDSLVSTDFNHNSHPSIFDSTQTRVIGNLVKIFSWYDNEWGFSNQMLRTAKYWFNQS